MKKYCLGLLAILCVSCATKSNWGLSHVHTGSACFNSSRLTYFAQDKYNGIDLELLATEAGTHAYLNVHSHPIVPYEDNSKQAMITIKIEGKTYPCKAARHEGGHRLRLTDETQDLIIQALLRNKPVFIETCGYHSILHPQDFSRKHKKLQTPSSFSNPFRLPF